MQNNRLCLLVEIIICTFVCGKVSNNSEQGHLVHMVQAMANL
jgi:hypothetical protein